MNIKLLLAFAVLVACVAGHQGSRNPQSQRPSGSHPSGSRPSGSRPSSTTESSSSASSTTTESPVSSDDVEIETRSLDEIYAAALAEGGKLILYAGGDTIGQQDATKAAFEARFPGMTLDVIVDLSKFHDARIDLQLETNTLIPDMCQLQTVQDFPRWKSEGVLLNYKPAAWEHVYDAIKDSEGAYTPIFIGMFGTVVNTDLITTSANFPTLAPGLLSSDLTNAMVGTYPNDDDAVLHWYKLIVDKYGWEMMYSLAEQNITFVRGTQASAEELAAGNYSAALATYGYSFVQSSSTPSYILVESADPFQSWAQTAAIFKNATRPEAAKLYLNWILDPEVQAGSISVRDDIESPTNKTIWDYTNTNPLDFISFMEDRTALEQFKQKITLIFGEVEGESPTGYPGTHPTEALAH